MANHCWNYVTIQGKTDTLDLIVSKFEDYDKVDYFVDFGNNVLDINKTADMGYHVYGTKWWDFEIEEDDDVIYIMGDSAWSPPIDLIEKICIKYGVTATMEYEESGMDFAGIVNMDSNVGIISHEEYTYNEYQYMNDVNHWIEHLSYNYEDATEDEMKNISEEHNYANESDITLLIESINELNKKLCIEK